MNFHIQANTIAVANVLYFRTLNGFPPTIGADFQTDWNKWSSNNLKSPTICGRSPPVNDGKVSEVFKSCSIYTNKVVNYWMIFWKGIRDKQATLLPQHKKGIFISSHWIFTIFICLVISAMRCREILFQPNLTQLFRFWKWNKTWLKMCTKDRTPETSQSFTLKPFSHYLFWKHIWTLFWKIGIKKL